MADISWARRMDATTGGAMVLTVDAVVFLMTALVGAPFVLFFMADGDDPVGPIWPMVTVWVVSAALGSASAAAAFLIGARGTQRIRQAGATTALVTAAATAVLVATSVSASPVLAAVSAVFAAANLGAAKLLYSSEPEAAAAPSLPEAFLLAAPLAEAEVRTRDTLEIDLRRASDDLPDEPEHESGEDPEPDQRPETEAAATNESPAATNETPRAESAATSENSQAEPAATHESPHTEPESTGTDLVQITRLSRPRARAALRTLSGIQLPPRARRPRPVRN
ncbi:hypothetical protein Acy02nite_25550 [Actinoplanes cyaneus]|uniref:Uncharacterized protein n=1 Tax=Actinoplanes cyaneus TaxID=52696 RepID=A0A919IF57_9ACTN|nr:hypothetical protein [Actinoplanes cyaneus]MCW2138115.1 hypothetical protein [Actinoplanes cyaneus]GID64674.1 hypothetical protein Acy02nite_25550 [Actinoplanes cyaneus]